MSKDNSVDQDPMAGGQEISTENVSFGKVKDFIKGTYTNHKTVQGKKGPVKLYEIMGQVGEYHKLLKDDDGNMFTDKNITKIIDGDYYNVWGGKDTIDDGFRKSKIGDVVGVQFAEAKPTKNKPFKIFRFVNFGANPDYNGQGSADVAEAFPGSEEVDKGEMVEGTPF